MASVFGANLKKAAISYELESKYKNYLYWIQRIYKHKRKKYDKYGE